MVAVTVVVMVTVTSCGDSHSDSCGAGEDNWQGLFMWLRPSLARTKGKDEVQGLFMQFKPALKSKFGGHLVGQSPVNVQCDCHHVMLCWMPPGWRGPRFLRKGEPAGNILRLNKALWVVKIASAVAGNVHQETACDWLQDDPT